MRSNLVQLLTLAGGRSRTGTMGTLSVSLFGAVGIIALLCLITVATWLFLGSTELRTLTVFLINVTAVVGIGVFTGNSGILSFGHLSFMGIGAFTTGILTLPLASKAVSLPNLPSYLADIQLELPASFLAAMLVAAVCATIVGIPISRLRGSSCAIATLGLLVIVYGVLVGARDYTRGAATFFGIPRETTPWIALAVAAAAIIVGRIFRDTAPGLQLRAARDNEMAAAAMGIDVNSRQLIGWVISGIIVAAAGVLFAHFLGTISPKQFFFIDTLPLLAMLIVGGMMTVTGAVAGTVLITIVIEILRRMETGVSLGGIEFPSFFGATHIGVSLIILLVLLRWPMGLISRLEWDQVFLSRLKSSDARVPSVGPDSEAVKGTRTISREVETIVAEGISKNFDGVVALSDVTLALTSNSIVGLIGPNGSGKSTLLNVFSGVLAPTDGRVVVFGENCTNMQPHIRARKGIGRTFQNIRLFTNLTVYENVLIGALAHWPKTTRTSAARRVEEILGDMNLLAEASSQASALSYGQQRRVEIARALALDPSFLLLDEPAAGMNPGESEDLMRELADIRERLGIGILIIDHDLSLIMRLCERVVVLNKGEIIADGTPEGIQTHPAVIEAYLGREYKKRQQGPSPNGEMS